MTGDILHPLEPDADDFGSDSRSSTKRQQLAQSRSKEMTTGVNILAVGKATETHEYDAIRSGKVGRRYSKKPIPKEARNWLGNHDKELLEMRLQDDALGREEKETGQMETSLGLLLTPTHVLRSPQ